MEHKPTINMVQIVVDQQGKKGSIAVMTITLKCYVPMAVFDRLF